MSSVKIANLKSRLSEHLRSVRRGEVVTVLDRTTPVAKLVPVEAAEDVVITPPRAGGPAFASVRLPRPPRVPVDVVALLLGERRRR